MEENLPAWELFLACQTQWRTTMSGLGGLDYTAVAAAMHMQRIRPAERADLFWRLRQIERGAIAALAEHRKQ